MKNPEVLWGEYRQILNRDSFDPQTAPFVDFVLAHSSSLQNHCSQEASVAIVIPAYNEERLIGRALAGINQMLEANPTSVDVVVVNNASTDSTAEIVGFFGARVVDEPVKGIAKARQAGLEAVRNSEITLTTDADSMVTANWLQAHVAALQSEEVVFSGGKLEFLLDRDLKGINRLHYGAYTAIRSLYRSLLRPRFKHQLTPSFCGANSAFKTAQAIEVGYRISVTVGEDTFLMHNLVEHFGGRAVVSDSRVLSSNRRTLGKGVWTQVSATAKKFVKLCLGTPDEIDPHQEYQDYR